MIFGFLYNGITIIDIVAVVRSFMFFNFGEQYLKFESCLNQ
jgi:hypothetical protein